MDLATTVFVTIALVAVGTLALFALYAIFDRTLLSGRTLWYIFETTFRDWRMGRKGRADWSGCRPIETAPKDGSTIELRHGNRRTKACWHAQSLGMGDFDRFQGWVVMTDGEGITPLALRYPDFKPTHWKQVDV